MENNSQTKLAQFDDAANELISTLKAEKADGRGVNILVTEIQKVIALAASISSGGFQAMKTNPAPTPQR